MFSYSLPSKTGALFLSDFAFEYFEYKTFRAEEHCLHSANILTYFMKKEKKQESLHEGENKKLPEKNRNEEQLQQLNKQHLENLKLASYIMVKY